VRYHHGCGCYGHGGWHQGYCGPEPEYGPAYGYGRSWNYGWDLLLPDEEPRPRSVRGRFGGGAVARQATAAQLEGYLESLKDEMRAIEQDLRDLRTSESRPSDKPEA
jgi:hypothetical protein